ncbi:MAG: glycosyltransferase family 2 protein [Anaerolineales bacterium]|nr:glycosyltransferase family 2 protein [Anaerolineales bacterium]
MRIGQNPVKSVEHIPPPAPVTVVVLVYIPFLSGYYAESLEVLKLCLGSLQANTPQGEYDLLVFDNGSCAAVREYLLAEQAAGRIQHLWLSERNLGKPAAWNAAFAAAPGEAVAYADSDVYFHPGWLQASLDALRAFPKAGMVTAMPMLVPQKYSSATLSWAKRQRGIKLERGELLPWEDFWRHARSLGDTQEQAREFYAQNQAIRLSAKGRHYYAGAAHFQFTAPKAALQAVLPIPAERPMGRVRLLDESMNKAGYLRLCTAEWHVQHMGNTLPSHEDLPGGPDQALSRAEKPAQSAGIWRWGPLRKLLQRIHGWSFDRLHRN